MTSRKLACGCVRGEFLCPEAEALWAEVNRAYRAAVAADLSARTRDKEVLDQVARHAWDKYERAKKEYRRHYKEEGNAD